MIENIPTDLHEQNYHRIMDEIKLLREKQGKHIHEYTKLGTKNTFYSFIDSILFPFEKIRVARLPIRFLLMVLSQYLVNRGKIQFSYHSHYLDYDSIKESVSNIEKWYLVKMVNFFLKLLKWYFIKRIKNSVLQIHQIWDRYNILQSTHLAPPRYGEYPWAIINAKLENSMKILDIGSGASLFPVYLASKNHEVTSIDNDKILMSLISPKLAEWAETSVRYEIGDATKLNFDDNSFDRVFCISVLEHLEEEEGVDGKRYNFHKKNLDVKAIAEMIRVVKPNGRIIITVDWSENLEDVRSYKIKDVYTRIIEPFKSHMISNIKLKIDWNELKKLHDKAWKSFSPYTSVDRPIEVWALGIVLKKSEKS